jgi:hypothetical protein
MISNLLSATRKFPHSMQHCRQTIFFWLYEIRRYKSIRLNSRSNGFDRMLGRGTNNDVEMILSPVACWQKKRDGNTYIHRWTAPCFMSLNTAHTPEGCGASCFFSLFVLRITFLVFLLLCLSSLFKSLNRRDSSQVLHLLRKTPAPKLHLLNNIFFFSGMRFPEINKLWVATAMNTDYLVPL